jgi:hypothetical protein
MARQGNDIRAPGVDTPPIKVSFPVEGAMPQTLIVIFLLFFAVLAFGWFYLQRAKARTTSTTTADTIEPVEPADPAEPAESPQSPPQ